MRVTLILRLVCLFVLSAPCLFAQKDHVDGVELATKKAPWTMRILGQGLDITEAKVRDDGGAYFMMRSESTRLNVSVYVEPVTQCKSAAECRDYVLGLGNPAWGKYEQLSKGTLREFSYFEFYRPEVQGRPVKMFDMYAEAVSQGYWVDLHISKALYTKEDHALFEKLVNSVEFLPHGSSAGAYALQKTKIQEAADAWLALWGNAKCKESYAALSAGTRADNPETDWVAFCSRFNNVLGPNTSRDLIGSAVSGPVASKKDRPSAILVFHSRFANGPPVVEMAGLVLGLDGKWIMTNYVPR